jgi:hypothetical protein
MAMTMTVTMKTPIQLAVPQLAEFIEYRGDGISIDIEGLQPCVIEEKVEDKTLYFLYKHNRPAIFHSIAESTLFYTKFAFIGTRTQRNTEKYMIPENIFRLCKKCKSLPKEVACRYRRSLYNPNQVLTALDEVGCMYAGCGGKKLLIRLRDTNSKKRHQALECSYRQ